MAGEDLFEALTTDNVFQDPRLLFQDLVWVDKFGFDMAIASMDPGYCSTVVRFLRRKSDSLLNLYLVAKAEDGFGVPDAMVAVVERGWGGWWFEWDAHPTFGNPEWLEHTPLVKALRRRAADAWPVEELLAEAPVAAV